MAMDIFHVEFGAATVVVTVTDVSRAIIQLVSAQQDGSDGLIISDKCNRVLHEAVLYHFTCLEEEKEIITAICCAL
jgi:hypothetical protein